MCARFCVWAKVQFRIYHIKTRQDLEKCLKTLKDVIVFQSDDVNSVWIGGESNVREDWHRPIRIDHEGGNGRSLQFVRFWWSVPFAFLSIKPRSCVGSTKDCLTPGFLALVLLRRPFSNNRWVIYTLGNQILGTLYTSSSTPMHAN